MPQLTIQQAMQAAFDHQCAGRLPQAEQLYRQVLAVDPRQPDALHLMGLIAAQAGQFQIAAELISQAISNRPGVGEFHRHLGAVMLDLGNADRAIEQLQTAIELDPKNPAAYEDLARAHESRNEFEPAILARRQAAVLNPNSADNWCNLGSLLQLTGRSIESIAASQKAISLDPNLAEAHNNLAAALTKTGRPREAEISARRSIQIKPDLAQAHNTLGSALWTLRDNLGAIRACREAIRLMPGLAMAHNNLGTSLMEIRQVYEAAAACRRAIELDPNITPTGIVLRDTLWQSERPSDAETACRNAIAAAPNRANPFVNLALVLMGQGEYEQAIAACREATRLDPDMNYACDNLAHALRQQGQLDEALEVLQTMVNRNLADVHIHGKLVFTHCYRTTETADANLGPAKVWADRWAAPLRPVSPAHANDRSPHRRLKIGYVSPDFRDHPVAMFLLTLLSSHSRSEFEIHCFSNVIAPDSLTAAVREKSDVWHDVVMMDDPTLADHIRREKIDILVDLAGHTSGNRLLVFARKPAPIQVTWLGYPATTGMDAIDYRLTDAHADPIGMTDAYQTEKLIRLPKTAWCFGSPVDAKMAVYREPSAPITFGCFNNFSKVNQPMLQLWAQILLRLPGSRLVLKSARLGSPSLTAQTLHTLEAAGVARDRIELLVWIDSSAGHLESYNSVDIALDTFPYHGTTTTCEALWMGVPVVTLAGHTHISRVGVSLLRNLGLPELIARDFEEYADIAVNLAKDKKRLEQLHLSLRDRLQDSPLMDAASFARDIESAYRQMYSDWANTF